MNNEEFDEIMRKLSHFHMGELSLDREIILQSIIEAKYRSEKMARFIKEVCEKYKITNKEDIASMLDQYLVNGNGLYDLEEYFEDFVEENAPEDDDEEEII